MRTLRRIHVLHNETRGSRFEAWIPGARLTLAARFWLPIEDAPDPEVLEVVWAIANSSPAIPAEQSPTGQPMEAELFGPAASYPDLVEQYREGGRTRSLSVGDVVLIDGRPWAVASFGWESIAEAVGAHAVEITPEGP